MLIRFGTGRHSKDLPLSTKARMMPMLRQRMEAMIWVEVREQVGKATDIGAYEFQAVPVDRILRVKPDGDDSKNGSDWGNALKSVQAAINKLADGGKVEKYGWQPVLTSLQFI